MHLGAMIHLRSMAPDEHNTAQHSKTAAGQTSHFAHGFVQKFSDHMLHKSGVVNSLTDNQRSLQSTTHRLVTTDHL